MPNDCLSPLRDRSPERVEPLQPRAVVEVKARHRVALRRGAVHAPGRPRTGGSAPRGRARRATAAWPRWPSVPRSPPVAASRRSRASASRSTVPLRRPRRQLARALQPLGKAGDGRERAKALELRQLALQLLGHALDQEVAHRHAAQARLAVADGVERRDLELARAPAAARACRSAARWWPASRAAAPPRRRSAARSGSCGWKKAKQRRSGCRRRRRSSQPSISCTASWRMICSSSCAGEFQSTRCICRKPGLNHDDSRCRKSFSSARNSGCAPTRASSLRRMATICAVPPGRAVDAPQQLLPRRLGQVGQADQVVGRRLLRIGLRHRQHGLRVGAEVAREAVEEAALLRPRARR